MDIKHGGLILAALLALGGFAGCRSSHNIHVDPVEVKPIHITIDVNVRVEKALDDFFADLDKESKTMEPAEEPKREGERK